MISKREIYDAEMEQRRTEEDGKYAAILAAQAREEEQKSQMQAAEDQKDGRPSANGIGSVQRQNLNDIPRQAPWLIPNHRVKSIDLLSPLILSQTRHIDNHI